MAMQKDPKKLTILITSTDYGLSTSLKYVSVDVRARLRARWSMKRKKNISIFAKKGKLGK